MKSGPVVALAALALAGAAYLLGRYTAPRAPRYTLHPTSGAPLAYRLDQHTGAVVLVGLSNGKPMFLPISDPRPIDEDIDAAAAAAK